MDYTCPGCGMTEQVPPGTNAIEAMQQFHQKHLMHNAFPDKALQPKVADTDYDMM